MMKSDFLNHLDHDKIVKAIQEAEKKTTGEIRVRISGRKILLWSDEMQVARRAFQTMGMTRTPDRNGVLVMVFPKRRRLVILGDKAVHEKAGQKFWEDMIEKAAHEFKEKKYTQGIIQTVDRIGKILAQYFPKTKSDRDSLPNKVIES